MQLKIMNLELRYSQEAKGGKPPFRFAYKHHLQRIHAFSGSL